MKFISQQSLPYRLLLIALVATMVAVGKTEIWSEVLGNCERMCNSTCIEKQPGGKGLCDQSMSKCYSECLKINQKCNVGLGRCSQRCNPRCCAEKCASGYPGGVGYCDDNLGAEYAVCQCQYPC